MIAAAFAGHLRAGRFDWRGVGEFAGRCTNRASSVSPIAGVCYPRHLQSIPIKLTLFNRRSGTPMRKRIVFATFLLSTCCVFWGNGFGQEARKPFTKQEILRLLKPTPGTRYEQGDLAGEIAQRGIAFPADEKTLDELRKAGARSFVIDAIQKAAQNAASKQTQPQSHTQEQPQSRNRPAAEAPTSDARPHLQSQSSPGDRARTTEEATR